MSGDNTQILFLADVEDSTRLERPELVYDRLDVVCRDLNERLSPLIPIQRQYGDEVAGLLNHAGALYDIISSFRAAAYPEARIRFVAVRGEVGVMDADISKVGGVVFKRANELIEVSKRKDRFGYFEIDPRYDVALDALAATSDYLLESMTVRQRAVYKLLKEGMTHEQIGQQFKISRQAVSDAAKRGGAELVLEAESAIGDILQNID